jgi:hypothetical protein
LVICAGVHYFFDHFRFIFWYCPVCVLVFIFIIIGGHVLVFIFIIIGGQVSVIIVAAVTADVTTTGIATVATNIGLIATVYKIVLTGRIGVGRGGIEFCITGS